MNNGSSKSDDNVEMDSVVTLSDEQAEALWGWLEDMAKAGRFLPLKQSETKSPLNVKIIRHSKP